MGKPKKLNDWSAVLHLVYGKKFFVFTGDAKVKSETDRIKSKQTLKADILKDGHHGAKTSTNSAFFIFTANGSKNSVKTVE